MNSSVRSPTGERAGLQNRAQQGGSGPRESARCGPRLLAVLLLALVLLWALFGKAFRFGQKSGRTIGHAVTIDFAHGLLAQDASGGWYSGARLLALRA